MPQIAAFGKRSDSQIIRICRGFREGLCYTAVAGRSVARMGR